MKEIIIICCLCCCSGSGEKRIGALGEKRIEPSDCRYRMSRWRRQKPPKVSN